MSPSDEARAMISCMRALTSRPVSTCAVFLLALSALLPQPAEAQDRWRDRLGDFSTNRFYVAPGPGNFVTVEGAQVGPDLLPGFGVTLGYANRPYAADELDCQTSGPPGQPNGADPGCADDVITETDLVRHLATLQLYGAFTFLERIQLSLNVPIILYYEGEDYSFTDFSDDRNPAPYTSAFGGSGAGLGDPRVSAKLRILDPDAQGNGVIMSVAAFVTLPVAHYIYPQRFLGDALPQGGFSAIGGFVFDSFRLALNLGLTFRDEQINIRSQSGTEFTWGLGAAYRPHPLFEIVAEAAGATSFGQRFDSEAPTEIRGAAVVHLDEVAIHAGAGAGLVYGIGVPVFHAFAGMSFQPRTDPDNDGDGLTNSVDGCPDDAEDRDGYDDEDGCPDLDNDEDGVPDAADPCPEEAEDLDGNEDEDGCPDEDNDGDGISDGYDSCPDTPEDMDGDRDTDGCPDTDRDQDGIADEADQCPDEAEDFDGFGDEDGCPEADLDEDGVPDEEDDCPQEAEDADGFEDEDGCPEEGAGRSRRRRGR